MVRWLRRNFLKCFQKNIGTEQESGMSLIEIIIVISLIGVIMSVIIVNLTGQQDQAMEDATRLAMGNVAQSLQMYRVHNYRYPAGDQGLEALLNNPGNAAKWRGPYIEESKLRDPWGNKFTYETDGRDFKIMSPGKDGVPGNEDDISYPDESAAGAEKKE